MVSHGASFTGVPGIGRMLGLLSMLWHRRSVTCRVIIRALPEQFRPLAMPVLECADGRSSFEDGLRELGVVEADVAQESLL